MYLVLMGLAMCLAYLMLFFFFQLFVGTKIKTLNSKAITSISIIAAGCFLAYSLALMIPDLELGNRFVHTFGGGFMGFITCFLAAKDSHALLSKFQFFILAILLVMALGVANEIAEYFLQTFAHFKFSQNINDTWLDLISNLIGTIIACIAVLPFLRGLNLR